jgi:hypothetical protein
MLAELERLTGLESTYVTSIDWERATQRITRARNVGMIDIPQGLTVDWSDTVCRLALEQGVPLVNVEGHIEGTLRGASSRPLDLGEGAVTLMEHFAQIIARGSGGADAVGAAHRADRSSSAARRAVARPARMALACAAGTHRSKERVP